MVADEEPQFKPLAIESFDEIPMADEELVVKGVNAVMGEFRNWINRTMDDGGDPSYTTGLMIAHNVYKVIIMDIVNATNMTNEMQERFLKQSILRLSQALLEPKESHEMERKTKERRKLNERSETGSEES